MPAIIGNLFAVYEEAPLSIGYTDHSKKAEISTDLKQTKGNLYVNANLKGIFLKVY